MVKKFYVCKTCGNMVEMVKESGMIMVCCGQNMTELIPCSTDGSKEKHVPDVAIDGKTVTVKIGSEAHPMTEEHYIEWIMIETKCGGQKKMLKPGSEPKATFILTDEDEFIAAYAYCNIHGLWKK